MPTYAFFQVDVFGSNGLDGNPLAVVHDAEGIDATQMQQFARWTGLSETTFLLPPTTDEADYRVRIFTTEEELPFAGHPTLGSAYAWLGAGGRPQAPNVVVQQCGAGLVRLRRDSGRLAFAAPPLTRFEPVEEELVGRIASGLGLDRQDILDASWLVNGPRWIGIRLPSAERVLDVRPDPGPLAGLDIGLVGPYPPGSETTYEVRALLPGQAVAEDPVTGSLNAGLAYWMTEVGLVPDHYVASQGTVLGRAGRVHIDREDGTIWVGGRVADVIQGHVTI
ncbi:MAG TPA: PhzF family phenazine biosynthesis protein [Propionibacteriaceae bacterium]|jgi:PhzF family phenazine biosynthesis protein|nr:PhzF family phenazine biosynthesis protein [Propionibacteriaceae bacterium]